MKLIFSANDYKYQIEAVMKLFLPAQKFEFFYDRFPDSFDGDFAFLRKRTFKSFTLLYAWVHFDGKSKRCSAKISQNSDENACEMELSRLLYLAMSALTGITTPWGILTGVRPVKQVHRLLEDGKSRNEIFDILQNKYLVSQSKCKIACDTAAVQLPALKRLAQSGQKTFGLYISIPFCPTRCSYCSFISQSASGAAVKKIIPKYIENLCEEIRCTAKITTQLGLKPDTVYFGGGTPTTLEAAQLARIMSAISENFDLSAVKEYTVEAGRPDTITVDKLAAIKAHGCNRISVNPQTLNNSVLKEIGRSHTAEQFFESFSLVRKCGIESVNTDIIAGLPTDTLESFCSTLDRLIDLSPESITVHTLSIKRSSGLNGDSGKSEILKNPAKAMVDYSADRLYQSGYLPYYLYRQKNMVDNLENIGWVKPGFESLYNIYIMEEVQSIIALGAAGSTKLVDRENSRLERVFNFKYPLDYNNNFELMLKRKEEIREFYAK